MEKINPFLPLHEGKTVYTDSYAYKAINNEIYVCDYTWDWHWLKCPKDSSGLRFFGVMSRKDFYLTPQVPEEQKQSIIDLLDKNIIGYQ